MQLRLKDLKDKLVRTKVHQFFKQTHGLPTLVSDTVAGKDGSMDVRVLARSDLRATVKRCAVFLSSGPRSHAARGSVPFCFLLSSSAPSVTRI